MSELKKCPFCNGDPRIKQLPDTITIQTGKVTNISESWMLNCNGHITFFGKSKQEVIDKWNCRVEVEDKRND